MKISVLIPAYNAAGFIFEALDSVFHQSVPVHEIIIVDDGSSDGTSGEVERWKELHGVNVTLLRQNNRGVSAARNSGIKASRGDWVALLDADDIWTTDHLQALEHAIKKYSDLVGVFGDGVYFGDTSINAGPIAREKALQAAVDQANDPIYLLGERFYEILIPGLFFAPSSFMFNREAALAAGLFDESIGASEDREFVLRLSRKGKFAFVDRPIAKLRIHQSNLTHPRNSTRNIYFSLKTLTKTLSRSAELELSDHEMDITHRELRRVGRALLYSASLQGITSYYRAQKYLIRSPAMSWGVFSVRHFLRAIHSSFKK